MRTPEVTTLQQHLSRFGSEPEAPCGSQELFDRYSRQVRGEAASSVVKAELEESWPDLPPKSHSLADYETMRMNLRFAPEAEITGIGKGVHRPYKVKFHRGYEVDGLDCRVAVAKTVWSQYETKRYCKSMDPTISGPEREILAYDLDLVMGFDLVPPTVGREVRVIGYASVQCWVLPKTAWESIESKGYNYKKHPRNPWLHRLAAFDFIVGQIDRHAANWMVDEGGRIYAIDNGYSFVKGDDRRFFKSSAGKLLVGEPIHPQVIEEIAGINTSAVERVLNSRGFKEGEEEGVLGRIEQLKKLSTWEKLGGLWG